jgi:hypothetical protein
MEAMQLKANRLADLEIRQGELGEEDTCGLTKAAHEAGNGEHTGETAPTCANRGKVD